MMSIKTKYKGVSLPEEIVDDVDSFVFSAPEYSSRADFIKKAITKKLKDEKGQSESLTDDEKRMLDAWARHRNDLRYMEEEDIGDLLLTDNGHVWSWLRGKLAHSIEYILKLRSNRN